MGVWVLIKRSLLAAALAATLTSGVAQAAGPDPIGPPSQSLADGCQRNIEGLLTFTSPEWVYVNAYDPQRFVDPDNTYVAEGVAFNAHTAEDDLPEGHSSFDLNADVTVDPQYQDLVAGDPAEQTGNYTPGDDQGTLHVEWETGFVPSWAWFTENDRVKLWGSWIWDCGHWGIGFPDYFLPSQVVGSVPVEGPITGERSEFHSMKFMVVTRANPYRAQKNETETDVYGSTQGGLAHAQEECARDHPASPGAPNYAPDYTACLQNPTTQDQTLNDRDYSFFVPAPPKPTPTSVLTYRVEDMIGGDEPSEVVTAEPSGNPPGINVTVLFNRSHASAYGKSFFVGWDTPDVHPPEHIQIDFNSVTVNHSLDPNPDRPFEETGAPPGEYELYVNANGDWKYLNDWAPGLGSVLDGQTFQLNHSEDLYVQSGKSLRVMFTGRECDFVGINPCFATGEIADQNDRPGTALTSFASVDDAIGQHTVASNISPQPTELDPNPTPNYVVTYTVRPVYPRPGSGSPLRVPLVPQFKKCVAPNSTHAAPLSLPSCKPPVQQSSLLTTSPIGKGGGFARLDTVADNPGTQADEADVRITGLATDVRKASDGSDYTGKVIFTTAIRITDSGNGGSGRNAGTVQDAELSIPVICVATADTNVGASCNLDTTADTLVPGVVKTGKRALISSFSVNVKDAGPDGSIAPSPDPLGLGCPPTCGSGDESVFLGQGVFAP
jgi:hypothetical protein